MAEDRTSAQGRDGRKDHQRRTGNDPHGPTGRSGGSYTPSAAKPYHSQEMLFHADGSEAGWWVSRSHNEDKGRPPELRPPTLYTWSELQEAKSSV